MQLANQGASIFVSDGDDGAQSTGPDGEDPLDPDWWCPCGGFCDLKDSTKQKCGEITLRHAETCNFIRHLKGMGFFHIFF